MDETALVFFAKVCQLFYRGNVYEVSLFMVCFTIIGNIAVR